MKRKLLHDSVLAEHIRLSDMASFTEVYNSCHTYLYYFSLRFLKSPELAEEAVHDVFLKLWENRGQLNVELSLKGYLIKICRNHILNMLSRATRERAVMAEIFRASSAGHNETEDAILSADYEAQADAIISMLAPQRQKIFRMYRFNEMDLDEIAHELGISKGTVKDHILKANRFIRKYLQAHTGIPMDVYLVLTLFSIDI
ncbi:RNA polymerase sigma factor [Dyadobacter bucti]|uniref:RNA polymerase sigma factor n=1 Tax=Dyadobacter bucti TaxID=2572203 RepID=UPI003F719AAF